MITMASACPSQADNKFGDCATTASAPRHRFCWSWRRQRRSGLIRPLEKLAHELRLDPSQYQHLVNLNAHWSVAGTDWRQRRMDETESWRTLFSAAQFDAEAAMHQLRGQGRWLEEQLMASLDRYQQFHASLTPWQRERLVEWLEKGWLGSAHRNSGWRRWRFWRR